MALEKNVAKSPAQRHHMLHLFAVMACGAIYGAAVLTSIGSLAHHWFSLTPPQLPLALAGGLAGIGIILTALALSSSTAGERADHAALVWAAPDPILRTPMTWTPAPTFALRTQAPLASHKLAARRAIGARRCAVRRRNLHHTLRRTRTMRSTRMLPPMGA